MNNGLDRYCTAREVASILRVHYKTLLYWIETGIVPAHRIGHKYLIDSHDLQTLLEKAKVEVW